MSQPESVKERQRAFAQALEKDILTNKEVIEIIKRPSPHTVSPEEMYRLCLTILREREHNLNDIKDL